MFEQSILLDHATGKKTGALAASLAAQTLGISVLILLPLIYNDHLAVRAWVSPSVPMTYVHRPPEPVQTSATSQPSRPSLPNDHVFRAPSHISPLIQLTDAEPSTFEPPAISTGSTGVPGISADLGTSVARHVEAPPEPVHAAVVTKAPAKPIQVSTGVQAA